jgi:hypothetical protein
LEQQRDAIDGDPFHIGDAHDSASARAVADGERFIGQRAQSRSKVIVRQDQARPDDRS